MIIKTLQFEDYEDFACDVSYVYDRVKSDDEYNSVGNCVLIYHRNNVYTKYCHLKYGRVKVKKNDIVQAGTILGTTGATGFATGVHLHYAVKENGKWVDPLDYLTGNKQLPSLENSTPIVGTGSKDLISYKVQKGDTLTKIAKMYKTTISELVNLNNIQNSIDNKWNNPFNNPNPLSEMPFSLYPQGYNPNMEFDIFSKN